MNLACHNCHEGQNKPTVTAMLSAARLEAGQPVTITVTAQHATAKVGGVLVDSKGMGSFELVDPTGTRLFDGTMTQATHAMPQTFANGQVQFAFRWIAPQMTGTVEFDIWSNAGNDNLMPADDGSNETIAAVSVGCDALWYYVDSDGDGAGTERGKQYSCEPIPNRITIGGDCDDMNPAVRPGALEICNNIDDNCDGQIDEGHNPVLLLTDADGDGFGSKTGMTMIGCPPVPGYATNFDDCDDTDPNVYPGAPEVINGRDDDCDGQRDEVDPTTGGSGTGGSAPITPNGADSSGGCAVSAGNAGTSASLLAILLVVGGVRRYGGAQASHRSRSA